MKNIRANELAIAKSVLYASLFDYPLTIDQLHQTLVESDQTPAAMLATYRSSRLLREIVECRDGFFFPAGRYDLIAERARREARSRAFIERHKRLLRVVCAMPFTRMVALSGSIAHLNLERDGDLDLFIVTRGRHVWTVTVAVVVLAKLMRQRRVVCANFVVADSHLALEQQDLFTANQIIHLKPITGAEFFGALLAANPFVAWFYPNFRADAPPAPEPRGALDREQPLVERLLGVVSPAIEALCRGAYGWHLRRRSISWRSPEQVRLEPDYLKLHTQSHRRHVLERLDLALRDALDRAGDASEPAASAAGRR